jgi:hypothetical protein
MAGEGDWRLLGRAAAWRPAGIVGPWCLARAAALGARPRCCTCCTCCTSPAPPIELPLRKHRRGAQRPLVARRSTLRQALPSRSSDPRIRAERRHGRGPAAIPWATWRQGRARREIAAAAPGRRRAARDAPGLRRGPAPAGRIARRIPLTGTQEGETPVWRY